MRAVAGAIVQGVGTKVFWVQTGGYDTHAQQSTNAANGSYATLMATLNDGVDVVLPRPRSNQGLLRDTLILQFSEFGRRITENGSNGTDHGAAGLMMAIGGTVRGGLYGTAAEADADPRNPTLENNGGDVTLRDRLPIRVRQGDRLVAGSGLRRNSRRGLPGRSSKLPLSVNSTARQLPRLSNRRSEIKSLQLERGSL